MKLFQLLPKKLYDFACNLPKPIVSGENGDSGDRATQEKPQIAQILSRLRACYRTQDCQCVFTTKDTENHKGHRAGAKRQTFHG